MSKVGQEQQILKGQARITRRSHTGILIYLQSAPIIWFSKKQNTIESSTFGSEFVALRTTLEMIEALRYKLRIFAWFVHQCVLLYQNE